jgi:hypothetical protein
MARLDQPDPLFERRARHLPQKREEPGGSRRRALLMDAWDQFQLAGTS